MLSARRRRARRCSPALLGPGVRLPNRQPRTVHVCDNGSGRGDAQRETANLAVETKEATRVPKANFPKCLDKIW